jgi:hypothetical protein
MHILQSSNDYFPHLTYKQSLYFLIFLEGCHGCDRMVVGFTTTCAMSAYHH